MVIKKNDCEFVITETRDGKWILAHFIKEYKTEKLAIKAADKFIKGEVK